MELRLFIIGSYEELVPSSIDFDIGYYKPSRGATKVYIKVIPTCKLCMKATKINVS